MGQSFLADLVTSSDGVFIRGTRPGASIEQVLAIEGEPTERRVPDPSGTLGQLRYTRELGEVEELTIDYAIDAKQQVVEIELRLVSYPHFYWKRSGDTDYEAWYGLLESARLATLTPAWAATRDELLAHLAKHLGATPRPKKPAGAFKLARHDGKLWSWTTPTATVVLMSYVDDHRVQSADDIKNTLTLRIT